MVTFLIVLLLAYIHAVLGLVSKLPHHTRTVLLKGPSSTPDTIDQVLSPQDLGLDKRGEQVAFTLCGDQEIHCAEYGHPVWLPSSCLWGSLNLNPHELCCPPNTACLRSSHTTSHMFCCPYGMSCGLNSPAQCPVHTFECPHDLHGGCCAIGLRCASDLCLEYHYKTLAVFKPTPVIGDISSILSHASDRAGAATIATSFFQPLESSDRAIAAATIPAQNVLLSESPGSAAVKPTWAWPNCQPGVPGYRAQNLPISDRILGTPTATRARIGEVAMESQADEGGESKSRQNRLKRLGCLLAGFVFITVVMLIL